MLSHPLALSLLSACAVRDAPSAVAVADPMAGFARMVPGEWRMTVESGTSTFDTWHWGPGRHSLRVVTDGSDAAGDSWRELQVYYWHPGREEIRLLGLGPFARSVSEGAIQLDGETADAVFDIHQAGGRRSMGLRWTFDGPDEYHEVLLEATDAGLTPIVEWDHVRTDGPPAPRPRTGRELPRGPERVKALEPLLGHTWEATGGDGGLRTTFEWVPLADAVYARTVAPTGAGEPTHLLDTYVYDHTGAGVLRWLTLSSSGGVYEGDITVLDDGALRMDLTGQAGDPIGHHAAQRDFAPDGTVRHRAWTRDAPEPTLDTVHRKTEPD